MSPASPLRRSLRHHRTDGRASVWRGDPDAQASAKVICWLRYYKVIHWCRGNTWHHHRRYVGPPVRRVPSPMGFKATLRLAPVVPNKVAMAQFPNVGRAVEAVQEILRTPYGANIRSCILSPDVTFHSSPVQNVSSCWMIIVSTASVSRFSFVQGSRSDECDQPCGNDTETISHTRFFVLQNPGSARGDLKSSGSTGGNREETLWQSV